MTRRRVGVLARLRSALSEGGVPALREAYLAAARESIVWRSAWRLVNLAFPVLRYLDWAVRLDGYIAAHGLHGAAGRLAEDFDLRWETEVCSGSEETLRKAPLVLYGNHPSQITPLIVAAALGRPDLRFLCLELYTKLLPGVKPYALPLQRSLERKWRGRLGSGVVHTLALSLLFMVEKPKSYADARACNQETLRAAAEHVRNGGSVLIFPMGEATGWRDWFPGIGVLARDLADTAEQHRAYLVPFFAKNESNARLYSLLSTSPLGKWRSRRLNRAPVQIQFAQPVPAEEAAADLTLSPTGLASLLQRRYRRLFFSAGRRRGQVHAPQR